jgi:hypothetical protein
LLDELRREVLGALYQLVDEVDLESHRERDLECGEIACVDGALERRGGLGTCLWGKGGEGAVVSTCMPVGKEKDLPCTCLE